MDVPQRLRALCVMALLVAVILPVSLAADADIDSDGDGVVDLLDADDDNDTISDDIEGDVDTDGDRVSDRLDRDSDNDGIVDLVEAIADRGLLGELDRDNDGELDDDIPLGGNGLADRVEIQIDGGMSLGGANDSDSDGIVDQRDLDTDNDGVPDVIEAGGLDEDGDGRTDRFRDLDGDGLSDVLSQFPIAVRDTDGDGIFNFRDLDSNQDGISDVVEAGSADTDSDGRLDSHTDVNMDGLDDAYGASDPPAEPPGTGDPMSPGTDQPPSDMPSADTASDINTGRSGGPLGCSMMATAPPGAASAGIDPTLMVLLCLAAGILIGRRQRYFKVPLCLVLLLSCSACSSILPRSDSRAPVNWLVSAGAGFSRFDIDTARTGRRVSDDTGSSVEIGVGLEQGQDRLELRLLDLGTGKFADGDTLGYQVLDLTAARAFGEHVFKPYLRAGAGVMFNDGTARSRVDNRFHLAVAAGLQFQPNRRWRLEGGLAAHDVDVLQASLVAVYAFGAAPVKAPVAEVVAVPIDSDGDGVVDDADRCQNTPRGTAIDTTGCPLFGQSSDGVIFIAESDRLSPESTPTLVRVLEALQRDVSLTLVVAAHVDLTDDSAENLLLSRRRSLSVLRWFTDRGVESLRLRPEAYGDSRPVSPGESVQSNTRIEFSSR